MDNNGNWHHKDGDLGSLVTEYFIDLFIFFQCDIAGITKWVLSKVTNYQN